MSAKCTSAWFCLVCEFLSNSVRIVYFMWKYDKSTAQMARYFYHDFLWEDNINMFGVLKSGGIIMIPIILCGIFATFIIIERCFYFYLTKKRDAKLLFDLDDLIAKGKLGEAEKICGEVETPLAIVLKKALSCRMWDERDLKDAVETELSSVVPRYEHWLTPLGTISNISTLLGLLGTVTGNIKAFAVLGAGGTMGDPAVLAGAIAEALVTTVAGLIVAIPAVIFYNYFVSRVNRRISDMEKSVTNVVIRLTGRVR